MIAGKSLEQRLSEADCVVQGEIIGVESFWTTLWYQFISKPETPESYKSFARRQPEIASIVTLSVESEIKPCGIGEQARFQVEGGHVGSSTSGFPPGHDYQVGKDVVVLLKKVPPESNLAEHAKKKRFRYILSGYNSMYYVVHGKTGLTLIQAFDGEILGNAKGPRSLTAEQMKKLSSQ